MNYTKHIYNKLNKLILLLIAITITPNLFAEINHTINIYNNTSETISFKYDINDCIPDKSADSFTVAPNSTYSLSVKDRNTLGKCRHTKKITYKFSSPVLFSSGNSNFTFNHDGTTGGTYYSWMDMFTNEGNFGSGTGTMGKGGAFPGTVTCNGSNCGDGDHIEGNSGSVSITFNQPATNPSSITGNIVNLSNYPIKLNNPSSPSNSNCTFNNAGSTAIIGSLYPASFSPTIYNNTSCGLSTSTIPINQQTNFGLQSSYNYRSSNPSFLSGSTTNRDGNPNANSFVACINMDPNNINNVMYKYGSSPASCWLGCNATSSGNKIIYKYYHNNKSTAPAVTLQKLSG